MAADTARQRDPALAALYWRLRHKGHHHTSATVAVANHLTSRIHAVLRDDRPYLFQDLDGDQIDRQDAYRIAQSLRPEQPPPHKEGPPSAPQNEETNEAQPFTHHTLIEEAKRLIRT